MKKYDQSSLSGICPSLKKTEAVLWRCIRQNRWAMIGNAWYYFNPVSDGTRGILTSDVKWDGDEAR